MGDYSLVPVDHQPDFDGVSLVPVDHDPFNMDNMASQPQMANEPQRTEPRTDRSNSNPPSGIDFTPKPNAETQLSGLVIPVCAYTDQQDSRRFGITTCNYFCGKEGTRSQTFSFGTRCPRLIRLPEE